MDERKTEPQKPPVESVPWLIMLLVKFLRETIIVAQFFIIRALWNRDVDREKEKSLWQRDNEVHWRSGAETLGETLNEIYERANNEKTIRVVKDTSSKP